MVDETIFCTTFNIENGVMINKLFNHFSNIINQYTIEILRWNSFFQIVLLFSLCKPNVVLPCMTYITLLFIYVK